MALSTATEANPFRPLQRGYDNTLILRAFHLLQHFERRNFAGCFPPPLPPQPSRSSTVLFDTRGELPLSSPDKTKNKSMRSNFLKTSKNSLLDVHGSKLPLPLSQLLLTRQGRRESYLPTCAHRALHRRQDLVPDLTGCAV